MAQSIGSALFSMPHHEVLAVLDRAREMPSIEAMFMWTAKSTVQIANRERTRTPVSTAGFCRSRPSVVFDSRANLIFLRFVEPYGSLLCALGPVARKQYEDEACPWFVTRPRFKPQRYSRASRVQVGPWSHESFNA